MTMITFGNDEYNYLRFCNWFTIDYDYTMPNDDTDDSNNASNW